MLLFKSNLCRCTTAALELAEVNAADAAAVAAGDLARATDDAAALTAALEAARADADAARAAAAAAAEAASSPPKIAAITSELRHAAAAAAAEADELRAEVGPLYKSRIQLTHIFESVWYQPLSPSSEKGFQNFAFKCNL
jgi:hypothetical protein